MRNAPTNDLASPAPADRGSGSPTTAPSPTTDQALRDPATAPAQGPAGPAVTVRGGGPDAPSFTAIVKATPTPAPAPEGPTHVVVSGDNLWTIARRHSAELAPILRWNDGVDPDRLVAGQRILVPGGSKMKPLPKPAPVKPQMASTRPAAVDQPAAPQAQDGDHLWPLAVRGDLTRGFSSAHPGIDIAAPQGTRVRAIAAGTVVWAGWKDNGGGYVVEIKHPDGMRSTYNHNSKPTVERGDTVAQGDTIALVGSTGNSTGPHLDLRIVMGGRLIDPLRFY
jgi:murein DD-endopeptidase MepM/ murein hydrolase activator NlpD